MSRQGNYGMSWGFPAMTVLLSVVLLSCGSKGGGGGGGAPAEIPDVAGTWTVHEVIDNTGCGKANDTDDYSITVQQSGASLTVVAPNGTFTGSVSGDQVSWTGQYADSSISGFVTITALSVTVTGNSFSGTAHWDFRATANGPVVCSGSTQVTGTRVASGTSLAKIEGTWYGAYQVGSTPHTLAVTADGSGHITNISRDGASLSLTGTIAAVQGASYDMYSMVLSDKTDGGFMVDAAATHAGFLTEDGDFGVLQKGATTLPTYALGDINGTWSGYSVGLDSEMNLIKQGASGVTVTGSDDVSRNLDGNDINGAFSASVTNPINTTYGYYSGGWQNQGGTGSLRVWLSADKTFAASWACDRSTSTVYSIANCTFAAWNMASPPPTAVPEAPTGLSATATSSSNINLSWTDASTNEESFRIERATSNSGEFSEIAAVPAGNTQFSDSGRSASTRYYYRVRARNSVGDSGYSNTADATTDPFQVQYTLTVSKAGTGSGTVVSSPVGINCGPDCTENYNSGAVVTLTATAATGSVFAAWSGACSGTGTCAVTLDAAKTVTATFNLMSTVTVPAAPTGLSATAESTTSINLTWTDVATETGYKVEQGKVVSNIVLWSPIGGTLPANALAYTDTSLTPSTLYYYRVRATNAAGDSPYSNTDSATTWSAGPTTVTLYSARDAGIVDGFAADTNYGSYATMQLGNDFMYGYPLSSYVKTGILVDFAFDPSTWSSKTIVSAILRLYVYDYAPQSTGRYVAYKIDDTLIGGYPQSPWSETGVTWNNAPTYALSPTSTAYAPVIPAQYTEWDVTSIVQGWFTSGTMGNGITILDMNPLSYTADQVTNYYSRQSSNEGYRPQLIITY